MDKAAGAFIHSGLSFQEQIKGNHCFGCGAENPQGLKIQSYWGADGIALCRFIPEPYHCAAPTHFLNGGIIATVIDCHCICTAIANAYRCSGRDIGDGEPIWFATGSLSLQYLRPVSINAKVVLKARVIAADERKAELSCELLADGKTAAEATLTAVKVPDSWMAEL